MNRSLPIYITVITANHIVVFHAGLIALGNIMFLVGIPLTIGVPDTIKFFAMRKRRVGSVSFLGGTFLILIGWTLVGLIVQGYGFWRLFATFIPTVLQYARKVPYLSTFLNLPPVKTVLNKIAPASSSQLPY
jgi:hypothetical protein